MFAVETNNGVTTLTLSHPPVNAISEEWIRSFDAKLDALAAGPRCGVLHIRSDQKVFCAGADIKERAGMSYDVGEHTTLNRLVASMFYAVKDCPKPVICAVNGPAVGAGFVLVTEEALLRSDLRALSSWINAQPEWSDMPFILLTHRGGGLERNPDAGHRVPPGPGLSPKPIGS